MNIHLSNADLIVLRQRVERTTQEIQVNYYNLYKSTQVLITTQNYTGPSADAFKTYLRRVTVSVITELLELTKDIETATQKLENEFKALESSNTGVVRQSSLESVRSGLTARRNTFEEHMDEVVQINQEVRSLGVTPGALGRSAVASSFSEARSLLRSVNIELNNIDRANLKELRRLTARVDRLRLILNRVNSTILRGSTHDFSQLANIPRNIVTGRSSVLERMRAEDLDNVSLASNTWSSTSDCGLIQRDGYWQFMYVTGGVTKLDLKRGKIAGFGEAGVFRGRHGVRIGSHIRNDTTVEALAVSGQGSLNATYGLHGLKGDTKLTVAGAKNVTTVGTDRDNVNLTFFVDAAASAKSDRKFKDINNWNFSKGGGAGAKIGASKGAQSGGGVFSASGAISAGLGKSANVSVSSQGVVTRGPIQINFYQVSAGAPVAKVVGVDGHVNFPALVPNVSWFGERAAIGANAALRVTRFR